VNDDDLLTIESLGLFFGDAPANGTTGSTTADIALTVASPTLEDGFSIFFADSVPDIDGDGERELWIVGTTFLERATYLLKSAALTNLGVSMLDLDNLAASDGVKLGALFGVPTVLEDYDGDGVPSFLIAGDGFTYVGDGSELAALTAADQNFGTGVGVPELALSSQGFSTIGDVDGDGLSEVISTPENSGLATVIRGSALRDRELGLATGEFTAAEFIQIDLRLVNPYGQFETDRPVYLPGLDQIAFGFSSRDQAFNEGVIIVIDASGIGPALQAGETVIEVR